MYAIVDSPPIRKSVHLRVFAAVVPIWVVTVFIFEYFFGGAQKILRQNRSLVVGAVFFFCLDFWTAIIYKVWVRDEERFTSRGIATGAKKLGLWIVIGVGSTIWSNTFPNQPDEINWLDPRWLGANVDLLGFLYMYAMDTISSIENVTGKSVGDTGIGRFFRAIIGHFFPNMEEDISRMDTDLGS